jgi:hypothetical protein
MRKTKTCQRCEMPCDGEYCDDCELDMAEGRDMMETIAALERME